MKAAPRTIAVHRRPTRQDHGSALVLVVVVAVLLAGLGAATITRTKREVILSGYQAERESAFQAAQAGIDDYIAKVTTDHLYFFHTVHPAESTRRDNGSPAVVAGAGQDWVGAKTWTYPTARNASVDLGNGYRYNLEVVPPSAATKSSVIVTATGWRSANPRTLRTLEVTFKGSSVADFQMMTEADMYYGQTAVTNGPVFSKGSIRFDGTANANLISLEATDTTPSAKWTGYNANPPTTLTGVWGSGVWAATLGIGAGNVLAVNKVRINSPAQIYDASNYTKVVSKVPDFTAFSAQLDTVKRAAQSISTGAKFYLPYDVTIDGYFIKFAAAGTLSVYKCKRIATGFPPLGASNSSSQQPTCTADPTRSNVAVPANGAIYSDMTVMVAGVVNGEVTVVSEGDGIIGDPTAVNSHVASSSSVTVLDYAVAGQDVLGLVARRDIIVPEWGPANMVATASVIAQYGKWRSGCIGNSGDSYPILTAVNEPKSTHTSSATSTAVAVPACSFIANNMTLNGSTATKGGSYFATVNNAGLYQGTRTYNYDTNLAYLVPPLFPVVDETYKIVRFREVNPR